MLGELIECLLSSAQVHLDGGVLAHIRVLLKESRASSSVPLRSARDVMLMRSCVQSELHCSPDHLARLLAESSVMGFLHPDRVEETPVMAARKGSENPMPSFTEQ